MAKVAISYVCRDCGAAHRKWSGRCEACGAWNSIEDDPGLSAAGPASKTLGRAKGRAPRGAISAAVESYLGAHGRKAIHASEILQALQDQGTAPEGRFPKASLLNTLQRLEKQGKVRNIGRNRWRKLTTH